MAIDNATLVPKKQNNNLLERGFKTRCENTSSTIRNKVGVNINAPLSYEQLANYLNVEILELENLKHLTRDSKTYLASSEGNEWSAVTVASSERVIIVSNPTHTEARRSSSIMHELAHVILEHAPGKVFITQDSFALRDYNDKQEAEADWLAGSLLLPREALLSIVAKRIPKDRALEQFVVSSELFEYRKRITGVTRQITRY